MANRNNVARVINQLEVLSDLMMGGGADAFVLLTDGAQTEIRILFAALCDELKAEARNV
ncbi:hypothetical protein [Burkholderia lata]|uniref:hypothetical protein n=1 Tax=Burkholderia lata (strain ATCC 17760 / DSM 23089 / LMG 22485 / NCIMB 9086 / R18194 / 383) TaxID=482957 RepID=UPI0014545AC9|nr:hypothetical protein [Burkholderia lata]VWB73669.1 hypothetical protein BLA15816_03499 [Burkholderia lata]